MNEMKMVRELLDAPPSASPQVVAQALGRLEGEMAGRSAGRRVTLSRRRFAGIGLAATAVAAAAALVVAVAGPGGTDRDGGSAPGAAPQTVRTVLLSAATKVELTPLTRGKYWSVVIQEGGEVSTERNVVYSVRETGIWDAGPGKSAWIANRDVSTRVLGPAPKNGPVIIRKPGAGQRRAVDKPPPAMPTPWTKVKVPGGEAFRLALWEGLKPTDVRKLPDDPERMRSVLLEKLRGLNSGPGFDIDQTEWMISHVQKIGSAPVSPKVLAAAYRMLATEPGMRVVGSVTDPLGRQGTGLVRRVTVEDGTVLDHQLILDQKTGRVLAYQEVLVEAGRQDPTAKVGRTSYAAVISYGWTNKVPDYPLGHIG